MGVLSFLISAVAVIIVFGLVIFIHELGHFLAAKRFGVKVNSFALGMGPAVWKKQKGETEYSFRAIPIGGYVKMEGEDGEFSGGDGVALESENGGRRTDGRAFYDKKPWQRFIILVSGAVMNIILGFLITILLNSLYTDVLPTTVVDALTPGYGAETVGIKPGDKIIKINGDGVHNTTDINIALMLARKDEASVLIERNGERLSFTVPVKWNGEKYVLGFTPLLSQKNSVNIISYSYFDALSYIKLTYASLAGMFTGNVSVDDMSGPVGIISTIGEAAQRGFADVLWIMILISLNLGVVNLLPLPALDGGRIIFTLIEMFTKRKPKPAVEGYIHTAGFALLILFMLYVTKNDIVRLFVK